MVHKKLFEFMMQTSSGTLGTIIGILLTIGTTYYQQQHEKKQMERIETLMVIHNLDNYCKQLERNVKRLETQDSLNRRIRQHINDNTLDKVPEDTLQLFIYNLTNITYLLVDNTAEYIFSTNIDTWKSIENSAFIAHVGKCFTNRKVLIKQYDDLCAKRKEVYYKLKMALNLCNNPCKTVREEVERIFKTPDIVFFMEELHEVYIPSLKSGVEALRSENSKNKRQMKISEQELKQFMKNQEFGKIVLYGEEKNKVKANDSIK